jgi:hypothetical protein
MTRKQFIESHGATCRNWQWSWSFINVTERIIIFGAWDKHQSGDRSLILDEQWQTSSTGRKQPAYEQAREHLRLVEEEGYLSRRTKGGLPMLRVIGGWCVFFNQGCVLHKMGMAEGNSFKYKPILCAVFPLDISDKGQWYIRQHGYQKEQWDLFCLNPNASSLPVAETMKDELALVEQIAISDESVTR